MNDPAKLLPYSRGDLPADLLLINAQVVNVFTGEVLPGNVAVVDGRIAGVGDYREGRSIIDLRGSIVAPGFIDAHMHIESTMLPPHEFARLALAHGTTGVVADPHEIANVHGRVGVRYMLASAATTPLRVHFMLPSCVPATDMESSGGALSVGSVKAMIDEPGIHGLAEMMNFPGVIHGDPQVMGKLRAAQGRVIDGHAPGVTGPALQAYIAAGISSDHEATTLDEAREKLRSGMTVLIREGSAARNLEALLPLVTPETAHRICFCTDDRHPDDLLREGHIDHVVRKAVSLGLDPITAIRMATISTAGHFRLHGHGAVAAGYYADFIIFDDLNDLRPRSIYVGGQLVAADGRAFFATNAEPPQPPRCVVKVPAELNENSLRVAAPDSACHIRVIGLTDAQLTTASLTRSATLRDQAIVADVDSDILKLAVIERHHETGNIGLGFVTGFGLKRGAIASTVAHDSHNLLVLGANDADMVLAARALADCGGGQIAVCDGQVLALLPLAIAGLMSDKPFETVVEQQDALRAAAESLGCRMRDPFMPLSFLSLPVIPSLKLTDRGLVDVDQFKFVDLIVGGGE